MNDKASLKKTLYFLGDELLNEIFDIGIVKEVEAKTELLKNGQYIKFIPIVINGLVKVITQFEEKELLLYYIQPAQSCIMSFSSGLKNEKSKIVAITEENSTVLLIPMEKISKWVIELPRINLLFYEQYELRYSELLLNFHGLLYHKLDTRLLDFLRRKARLTGKNHVRISHKEIAAELGTAREVVSRLIKKLENQHLLRQHNDTIEIIMPV
ncbi:MAG: Crp/Fnr family transcriptional regulator [Bacteroidales bacterium]|nr:Crp/Fnr family transcriptional regulator [Bacteroidales bacterium]